VHHNPSHYEQESVEGKVAAKQLPKIQDVVILIPSAYWPYQLDRLRMAGCTKDVAVIAVGGLPVKVIIFTSAG
jgi:hypothetical protein